MQQRRSGTIGIALGLLLAATVVAGADEVPVGGTTADTWAGSWQVTMTAKYSSCRSAKMGQTHRSILVVQETHRRLSVREIPDDTGVAPINYAPVADNSASPQSVVHVRSMAKRREIGMNLSVTSPDQMSGLRVVVEKAAMCAVVYALTGIRLTDAAGKRVQAHGNAAAVDSLEARMDVDSPVSEVKGSSPSPKVVMGRIRKLYSTGLANCFKPILKIDPTAAGFIRLKFQVASSGRVVRVATKGFGYPELDKCVESKVMKWTFPKPHDENGWATSVTFKVSIPFKGI